MAGVGDALGAGYISSLAHPGGNITGLTLVATGQSPKRVQLLQEASPDVIRIAALWNPNASGHVFQMKELEPAAPSLGITLRSFPVRRLEEIDPALQAAAQVGVQAILVMEDPMIQSARSRIAEFAMQQHWLAIGEFRPIVDAGALMSYGPDPVDLWRRSAGYVDKILKGANAGDLPVEQPVKCRQSQDGRGAWPYLPPVLMGLADEVIE